MLFTTKQKIRVTLCSVALCLISACGGGGGESSNNTNAVDTTPDSFIITTVTDTATAQWIESAAITISGINSVTSISVTNGEYSVNGSAFTANNGQVTNGDRVVLRHQSSATPGVTTTSRLTIGGVSATFSSITQAATNSQTTAGVSILFPLGEAKTEQDAITVSGVVTSYVPVTDLRVNGVAATIDNLSAAVPGKVTAVTSEAPTTVTWSAEVSLAANSDNTLTVEVTDAAGGRDTDAASVVVSRKFAPSIFAFDQASNMMYAMVQENELVRINLENQEYLSLGIQNNVSNIAFSAEKNKVFHGSALGNEVTLFQIDATNGSSSKLHSFQVTLSEGQFVNVGKLSYVNTADALYFVLKYPADTREENKFELYRFNFADSSLTLVSGDSIGNGIKLESDQIIVSANAILSLTWERQGIVQIAPDTGDRTLLVDNIPGYNMALTFGETDDVVYVAGFEGVYRVNLTTADITNISPESAQDIYVTSQIQSLAYDADANRVLMSDSMAGLVLAIDTTTGIRSKVLSSGVGEGRYLLVPQFIAHAQGSNTLYVLDTDSNAKSALLAVDLTTSDRSFVTDSANLPPQGAADLLLDEERNRLIAIYQKQILSIDIATKAVSVIKTTNDSYFSGGVIDKAANSLLVGSHNTANTLFAIDLDSYQQQVVIITPEDTNVEGIVDIALNANGEKLYMLSQSQGVIYQVDRSTNSATAIVTECFNSASQNMLDVNYTTAHNLVYNEQTNSLLATAGAVLEVDLADNSCIAYGNGVVSNFDISPTADNSLIVTQQNKLLQFDKQNNQAVVISR